MTSDLIFVLAGLDDRKRYALQLFQQRVAPKILLSVSRFEIRRFANLGLPVPLNLLERASKIPPPQRHFFVLFEGQAVQVSYVKPKRFGTLLEIEALMRWLRKHPEIHSLVIVSSNSHLRRIRMCCKSLLSDSFEVRFIAVPEDPIRRWDSDFAKKSSVEICKTAVYWLLLKSRQYT
jgi:hypothetical protein